IKQEDWIYYKGNEEAFKILFQGRVPAAGEAFQFWEGALGTLYEHIHRMEDAYGGEGLYLGIPYPGIQILVPSFIEKPITRQEVEAGQLTAKGLKIDLPGDGQEPLTVYFRNVPDFIRRFLRSEPSLQKALRYLGTPRPPVGAGPRHWIMEIPI